MLAAARIAEQACGWLSRGMVNRYDLQRLIECLRIECSSEFEREWAEMSVRGIRGATCVDCDNPELLLAATRELLAELLQQNQIVDFDEIVSAIFTTTPDLTSTFPAEAARALGMRQVPLLCASEIAVPQALPRCIRVLLHVNSSKAPSEIVHVYLGEARKLRPDIQSAQ